MESDLEALPMALSPMLATPGELPTGPGWAFETKWDGVRALVAVGSNSGSSPSATGGLGGAARGGAVRAWTRTGNELHTSFPELEALTRPLDGHSVLLDGEIVVFENAIPRFHAIQQRLGVRGPAAVARSHSHPAIFVVFDVLHIDGVSTRRLSFEQRRTLLDRLDMGAGPQWHVSSLHDDGALLSEVTRDSGLEGVVAKRLDSPYLPAVRSRSWIKHRNTNSDQFVIGGWLPGEGRRSSSIGSLLIGIPEDDSGKALRYVGRVGTGFTDAELEKLRELLTPLVRATSPFDRDVGDPRTLFVEPVLRAEVVYLEFTPDGVLRAPSYRGLVQEDS